QELDIESAHKVQTKSNIYKGTITKVEASLQAAFIEYGANRQGFLPLQDIHPDFWKEGCDKDADPRKINIQDVLEAKQSVLVQVVKEERGNKGAALTTFISLAGRYLVLTPNTQRGGISRKLKESDRRAIREILTQLNVPENTGLIVRTAGKDQKLESLQRDFSYLQRLWDEIRIKSESAPSPSLIYLEGDLATRAIRDHFTDDIQEIWVDKHDIYQRTKQFVHAVLPGKEKLVKLYRGKKPLFRQHGIEDQCEEIHEREIRLPSGGSIVLDPTEALTSIDINSSRSTGQKHIDDTALATNLEAAAEIARQLRIRDIGGLIVIDFIDMANRKHAQQVEEMLRDACKSDKARVQFARISRFGLLEMSRQRLRPSIRESTTETCPRCVGRGRVRVVESMALQMLTRMEDHAGSGKGPVLLVQVPKDTGEYLMNNKRNYVNRIEENYELQINLQIRPDLEIPHYRIERQWTDEGQQRIEVLEDTMKGKKPTRPRRKMKPSTPIVGVPSVEDDAPEQNEEEQKEGLLGKIGDLLFGGVRRRKEEAERKAEEDRKKQEEEARAARNRSRRRGGRRRGGRGRRPGTPNNNTSNGQAATEQNEQPKTDQQNTDAAKNGEAKASQQDKPRRRRGGRGRGRKTDANTSDDQITDSNSKQQAADNQTGESKPANKPSQTSESPATDKSVQTDTSAQTNRPEQTSKPDGDNNPENADKPRRRRRRRPRRSPGEQEASATQGDTQQAKQNTSSGEKPTSSTPSTDKPATVAEKPQPAVAAGGE
ncbi:MAG: Rne/Rng family ribonuclease, partial [Mariprofundaceae bacterium]|nr:Rne/Rng family ribonuclease [Mariprofundaceae bacterium]